MKYIILAISLLAPIVNADEIYFKVGAGYKVAQHDSFRYQGQLYKFDDVSPYSARFELGVQKGRFTYGVAHYSQWDSGFPFNDKEEPNRTELFIDVKFTLWEL